MEHKTKRLVRRSCTKPKRWGDHYGSFLPLSVIKRRSKRWNRKTWEAYLRAIEMSQREMLCEDFDEVSEDAQVKETLKAISIERGESQIRKQACANSDKELQRSQIEKHLHELTPVEALVVRSILWGITTEEQLAIAMRRTQPSVNQIKKRAISKLKLLVLDGKPPSQKR